MRVTVHAQTRVIVENILNYHLSTINYNRLNGALKIANNQTDKETEIKLFARESFVRLLVYFFPEKFSNKPQPYALDHVSGSLISSPVSSAWNE